MHCEEARQALEPRPGRRPTARSLEAEAFAHYEDCPACKRFFMRQEALRERLQRLSRVSAPPLLRQRIHAGLARAVSVRRRRATRARWLGGGGVLAAAVLLILFVARSPHARVPEAVIRPLVAQAAPRSTTAANGVDAVTTSNAPVLRRWFAERVPYRVDVPQIDGAVLVGGRVVDLAGSRTAAMEYRFHDRPLIFLALPTARVMGRAVDGEEIAAGSSEGYQVAVWVDHGFARAVVAPLPRSAVVGFAAACRAKARRAS